MKLSEILVSLALSAACFFIGKKVGEKSADSDLADLNQFYKNQASKQAVQIEKIKDRLVYLTVDDIDDFVNFVKDKDGFNADNNYPILAIVNPLDEANLEME